MSGDPRLEQAYARAVERARLEASYPDRRRLPGDVFVAPVGTEPGQDGWTHLGTATRAELEYADPVDPGDGESPWGGTAWHELLRGGTVTATLKWPKHMQATIRRMFGRCWGPRPLAPGCLPASTIARKRGGRS